MAQGGWGWGREVGGTEKKLDILNLYIPIFHYFET